MHEVITISCSQSAGHAAAQLYNVQEAHIPYRRNSVVHHHNNIFLDQIRINGRSNYYPRNISVQYGGGYGSLRKHEYSEAKTDPAALMQDQLGLQQKLQLVDQPAVPKNEFQANLDAGRPTSAALLSTENTRYWTDYNKLIYKPEALVELPNYQHDGTHRNFPRMSFTGHATGCTEFSALEETVDETFRRSLEHADCIQGVNFLSEVDGAWGAFTNSMIEYLRDEYFNNGVSSKHNLWVYGFCRGCSGHVNRLSAIKAFSDFSRNATLFFPMQVPPVGGLLSAGYDASNLWHSGSVQSVFINSLWGLNCSVQNQVKMAAIEDNLLRGYDKRNVVNEIRVIQDVSPEADFSDISDIAQIQDLYAMAAPATPTDLRFGVSSTADADFSCNVVRGPASRHSPPASANVYENSHLQEILGMDTFPDIMQDTDYATEFATSCSLREKLKEDRNIVSRVRMQDHVDAIGGDRGELVEELSSLIDEYTTGYSDESDYE